jgi:hypothetical protein
MRLLQMTPCNNIGKTTEHERKDVNAAQHGQYDGDVGIFSIRATCTEVRIL